MVLKSVKFSKPLLPSVLCTTPRGQSVSWAVVYLGSVLKILVC